MKIAYIISMKSGIPGFNYTEIKEMNSRGFEVIIYPTKIDQGPYMPPREWHVHQWHMLTIIASVLSYLIHHPINFIRYFVRAVKLRSSIDLLLAINFSRSMRDQDVRHIHCHFGDHKFFIGYWCKQILDLPLTVTIHSHSLYINPNWLMFETALNSCDRIITISDYNRDILINKYKVDSENVIVNRLFVDLNKYRPKEGSDGDAFSILIVGQFDARKGHDMLFEAVSRLNNDAIEIWAAGGGSNSGEEIDIIKLAEKFDITNQVKIMRFPPEDELIELYNSCSVFCLPSRTAPDGNKEGVPVVLMEAMACGKPVISTIHAGIPELVTEILVKEDDVQGLMEAIDRLFGDIELRKGLGAANREFIENNYSKRNVDTLQDIFTKLI